MTAKRTHGPCTCADVVAGVPALGCHPDCPSLYSAQQEPDALTRLVRHIRNRLGANSVLWEEQALTLISEAREEQRKARNGGLKDASRIARELAGKANGYPERQKAALDIAVLVLEAKDPEP